MAPPVRRQSIAAVVACLVCFILGLNFRPPAARWSQPPPLVFRSPQSAPSPTPAPSVVVPATPCPQVPLQPENRRAGEGSGGDCLAATTRHYKQYFAFSQHGESMRKKHGPLKIAGFSRLWVPPLHGTGGMQYHALHLYSQLAARGHTVHVFVTGGPDAHRVLYFGVNPNTLKIREVDGSDAAALTIHQVASDKNGEYSETWFHNVLNTYAKVNASVGGFNVAHSESWAGVPNAYQIGLQMAVTWHGSMLDWFRNEINLIVHNFRMKGKMTGSHTVQRMNSLGASVAYEAYMLLTVPHHIVISDSAASDLKEINLVDANRVHLIYNGVNPQNFRPDRSVRASFLSEHAIDPEDFVVGCGGRLEGIKGHHQLSKAMEIVLSRRKNVALLVAGTGGESRRYEELRSKGLKVVLLGMLKQENLAKFYQSIDVFVDPFYQHHGLNTVMIEAVLSGTPIIATNLASAKTTAPCEDFGLTFGLGEVEQLVKAIERFADDPDERARVGKNVRERATHLFSSTIMAGSYESLLYDMWLNPIPLQPITGKVVCKHTYPAMCYREPTAAS